MRSRELFCIALLAIVASAGASPPDWSPGPSLNVPRSRLGACVAPCGDIYAVGGHSKAALPLNAVEILEFDSVTGYAEAWLEVAPITTARHLHAVACISGFIYAIGGIGDRGVLASVERYDTTADAPTWDAASVPDLNIARYGAGSTVDERGRIWVVGGDDGTATSLSSVEIYDPARPELGWTFGPKLNVARESAGVVTDRIGRIYAIGGSTFPVHIASVERFDPCKPDDGWVLLEEEILGTPSQQDESVLGADGRIYVAGGWLPGYTNRVVRFDPNTDTWQDWVPLIQERNLMGLVLGNDGRIYAIGGEFAGFTPTATVEVLTAPCGSTPPLARPRLMDSNGDGEVGAIDLLKLLANWGVCP